MSGGADREDWAWLKPTDIVFFPLSSLNDKQIYIFRSNYLHNENKNNIKDKKESMLNI